MSHHIPNTIEAFEMTSSSGEPHRVEVCLIHGNKLTINCICPGAQMQTTCKHAKAILDADEAAFANPEQLPAFRSMYDGIMASELFADFTVLNNELKRIAAEKKQLTQQLDAETTSLKKVFFAKMCRGY